MQDAVASARDLEAGYRLETGGEDWRRARRVAGEETRRRALRRVHVRRNIAAFAQKQHVSGFRTGAGLRVRKAFHARFEVRRMRGRLLVFLRVRKRMLERARLREEQEYCE